MKAISSRAPRHLAVRGSLTQGEIRQAVNGQPWRRLVMPTGFPTTNVWGYGPAAAQNGPTIFNAPSLTIEAKQGKAVRVKWINELVDGSGQGLFNQEDGTGGGMQGTDASIGAETVAPRSLELDRVSQHGFAEVIKRLAAYASRRDASSP